MKILDKYFTLTRQMWRRFTEWINGILSWVGGLFKKPEMIPPPPELPPLSDADYERIFLRSLDWMAAGEVERVWQELGDRTQDKFFKSWLRRFGQKVLDSPVPNRQLAQRMVALKAINCGGICEIAAEYGDRQLNRDFPPLTESETAVLFEQLLQKVGQNESAVVQFLEDVESRITGDRWVTWLQEYGDDLLAKAKPNYQLVAPLRLLKHQIYHRPKFTELGNLAGAIAQQLEQKEEQEEIWEYDGLDRNLGGESSREK